MKSTDELSSEHRGIEVMLDILDEAARRIVTGEPADFGHLEGMMEFLSVFADKCHHGKEEEFLFPSLEAAGIPNEGGPIGVMLSEHRKGRECIAGMKKGVAALDGRGTKKETSCLPTTPGSTRILQAAYPEGGQCPFRHGAAARCREGAVPGSLRSRRRNGSGKAGTRNSTPSWTG
ncbi:hemerythrin domain-containing protein [Aminivibrio sp.]|uniref:hemerythrin domain-containing protein n=1 Tax=Aminivibrio sp. TaxID=1872489 RepID=UPI00345F0D93